MKKLLSILTISTLTASIPAPLLANTLLILTKRDIGSLTSNSNNDYLPLKEFNGLGKNIFYPAVDSNDNIYFVLKNKLFVLKHGESTPKEINGISSVISIVVDNKDNVYFGSVFFNFSILQTYFVVNKTTK